MVSLPAKSAVDVIFPSTISKPNYEPRRWLRPVLQAQSIILCEGEITRGLLRDDKTKVKEVLKKTAYYTRNTLSCGRVFCHLKPGTSDSCRKYKVNYREVDRKGIRLSIWYNLFTNPSAEYKKAVEIRKKQPIEELKAELNSHRKYYETIRTVFYTAIWVDQPLEKFCLLLKLLRETAAHIAACLLRLASRENNKQQVKSILQQCGHLTLFKYSKETHLMEIQIHGDLLEQEKKDPHEYGDSGNTLWEYYLDAAVEHSKIEPKKTEIEAISQFIERINQIFMQMQQPPFSVDWRKPAFEEDRFFIKNGKPRGSFVIIKYDPTGQEEHSVMLEQIDTLKKIKKRIAFDIERFQLFLHHMKGEESAVEKSLKEWGDQLVFPTQAIQLVFDTPSFATLNDGSLQLDLRLFQSSQEFRVPLSIETSTKETLRIKYTQFVDRVKSMKSNYRTLTQDCLPAIINQLKGKLAGIQRCMANICTVFCNGIRKVYRKDARTVRLITQDLEGLSITKKTLPDEKKKVSS